MAKGKEKSCKTCKNFKCNISFHKTLKKIFQSDIKAMDNFIAEMTKERHKEERADKRLEDNKIVKPAIFQLSTE